MEITSDLYGIAERIREIDPAYLIERNPESGRYELHNRRNRPTFVLAFPFRELDARAVEYARKTRAERHEALIRAIEAHNLRAALDAEKAAKEKISAGIESELSKRK